MTESRERPHHDPVGGEGDTPFGSPTRAARRRLRVAGTAGILAAVALAAVALAAWLGGRADPATAAPGHNHAAMPAVDSARPVVLGADEARRIGVTFAAATRGRLEREVRVVGQVTYDETRVTRIVSRVDGYVERLDVNTTGQPVRRGEALFRLYSPMVVAAEEELLLARRLGARVAGGSPDAVTGAESLLEAAHRRLRAWDVPESVIEDVLRSGTARQAITFRSPVSGVVVEKPILAGQRIMAGDLAYQIADLSRVWLVGEVFEPDLAAIHLGQTVEAEFPALPGENREGRITYIYPTLSPETRTARVRVELPNPGLRLKPGMYATFRITAVAGDVLSVPRSAVLVTGRRNLVFVRDSAGTLLPREVTLGAATDDRIEILAGLADDETVVSSATFLIDAESNLGTALGGMERDTLPDAASPTGPAEHRHAAAADTPVPPSAAAVPMEDMPGMTPGAAGGRE